MTTLKSGDPRAPQAFVLDVDDSIVTKSTRAKQKQIPDITFAEELTDTALVAVPETGARTTPRRFRWAALLVGSLTTLIALWAVTSIVQLIQIFFAQNLFLGWTALVVAAIAAISALAIVLREIIGLLRLNTIETLQETAARAINLDENLAARETVSGLTTLYAGRRDMRLALQQLASHERDIIDPRDRVQLADRLLLTPLDAEAHKIIARRARRVTLLTTVTPAAALDMLFVGSQNIGMLRDIATLYGGKPSTLATLKLARMVVTHLAVAGGLALSDNFIQLFLGKGLLGKISARFGEGAVNGILTGRIGLAALEVCRPIPKPASARESLPQLLKEITRFSDPEKDAKD
jgi:putative membrane protein